MIFLIGEFLLFGWQYYSNSLIFLYTSLLSMTEIKGIDKSKCLPLIYFFRFSFLLVTSGSLCACKMRLKSKKK